MPDKLQELLLSGDSPIVGPETARQLAIFAAEPEPDLAEKAQVEVMIGKLAMATAQARVSQAEASERMEAYWLALNDIPLPDLRHAYAELVRTATFLPTPAEVRSASLGIGATRRFAKSRARYLAWKHEMEWRPATELMPIEEVAKLLESAGVGGS